ncbi:Uncharacterised protein [Shigella sonnei]|nr:Uncharacterised protein [Shigella sonnei]
MAFEISRIVAHFWQNIFACQSWRYVPRRVYHYVVKGTAHHRRFAIGATDNDSRIQHLIAVLIVDQRIGRNVNHDPGRKLCWQQAQSLDVESQHASTLGGRYV